MHGKDLLKVPLCHKEPAKGFSSLELVLYGIRELQCSTLGRDWFI